MKKKSIILPVIALITGLCFSCLYIDAAKCSAGSSEMSAASFVNNMNTGWNLGNSLDAYYGDATGDGNLAQETVWGNPQITKVQIDYVKSLGFDVIRVPVSWHTHIYRDDSGAIHIHKDWLKRVKEVVDYCISDGLYVILNTHHDADLIYAGVDDSSFVTVKNNAASLWAEIATYFAAYDQHLIFESYNEVDNFECSWSFGSRAASQVNELNQLFVDVVRNCGGNNRDRLLMVPTLLDKTETNFQKAFKLPKDTAKNKLIVTVHDYSKQFDQSLDASFASLEAFSKKIGAPIIIGEWGTTYDYVPSSFRNTHAANFIARAKDHGLKCIYWDNGSNFAIVDRINLTCNQELISGIMTPSPYQSEALSMLKKWNNFLYMTFDLDTGVLKEDKHWGTIVVNKDGDGRCNIPSDKTMLSVSLITSGSMTEQKIHCLYFFDANNNLIASSNDPLGYNENTVAIPEGSSYVRIGINNPYSPTPLADYKKAIKNGEFVFMINFF